MVNKTFFFSFFIFHFLKFKFSSRSCGKLFCSTCCYELIQLPASYEYETPQRVCEDCKLSLQEEEKKKKERYGKQQKETLFKEKT